MNDTAPSWDRHDERQHLCGCETYFDLALGRSVATWRCDDHATEGDDR